jgi:ATP-dependent Zn protease
VLADLDALVGLAKVKAEVRRLAALLEVAEMRRKAGLPVPDVAHHLAFVGPPGTGKTTVARLLGRLFKALGILATDTVVEVDRSGLVAGYVGQTAIRVDQVVDTALGGVLFVDEAYALRGTSDNDFGHEAIATLLKRMEDDRHRLVVVLAGYDEPMQRLLASNPGLESRVTTILRFGSYTAEELAEIFAREAASTGFDLAPGATERVREICELMCGSEDPETFGNAREVRNLFEDTVGAQAERLVALTRAGAVPDAGALRELVADDVRWAELGDVALEVTLTDDERRRVAYHEIGHALVGHLCGGPPPVLVTVVPSARAAGRAFFAVDRRTVLTRGDVVAVAARALGGRAAEQLAFGAPSTGAASDLELAERVVLRLLHAGLSEERPEEALAEFAATSPSDGSGWRGERARQEIAELLQEAYALAERVLGEREAALHDAAAALAARRTLRAGELAELFGPAPAAAPA